MGNVGCFFKKKSPVTSSRFLKEIMQRPLKYTKRRCLRSIKNANVSSFRRGCTLSVFKKVRTRFAFWYTRSRNVVRSMSQCGVVSNRIVRVLLVRSNDAYDSSVNAVIVDRACVETPLMSFGMSLCHYCALMARLRRLNENYFYFLSYHSGWKKPFCPYHASIVSIASVLQQASAIQPRFSVLFMIAMMMEVAADK